MIDLFHEPNRQVISLTLIDQADHFLVVPVEVGERPAETQHEWCPDDL